MKFLKERIFQYAKKKYKTEYEFLWQKFPNYAVLRHEENRKWYAIIMDVSKKRLKNKKISMELMRSVDRVEFQTG